MLGRVREELPHASVTSDFIVGFCGETDEEFAATLDLVRTAGFKNSFIFKYSPRPGTKAHERLPDDVPEDLKRERNRLLLEAQAEASLAGNLRFVGTRQRVLVEGLSAREERQNSAPAPDAVVQLSGRTTCDRIVVFDAPGRLVGRIVDVDVLSAGAWSLSGIVADGLADAVPLEGLGIAEENPGDLYEIATPARTREP
jgi:tRNA-2-methylthio-N6-dimethylallyladenosine synthase